MAALPSLLCAGLLCAPTPPAHVRIAFSRAGAEACVPQAALEGAISALLGYDPFAGRAAPDREVELSITPEANGFSARLTLRDARGTFLGERTLAVMAGGCEDLTEALALALATAIDPVRLAARAPVAPAPAAPASPAAPAPVCEAQAPPPAPPRPAAPPPELTASLGALGALGAAPRLNPGALLDLTLRFPRFALMLGGRADWPASASFGGGNVSTALLTGEIAPCFRAGGFGACALALVGSETAAASGLPGSTPRAAFYAAAGARLLGEWTIAGPFAVRAAADLTAPLTRENVLVGDALAFTSPALAIAGSLSAVLRLY